jgi:hypothetical protein
MAEEMQMKATTLNYRSFSTLPVQKDTAQSMETHQMNVNSSRRPLTFGDFVAGVCHTWGERRAKGIIDLAIKMHVIEFRGTQRFVIS